MSAPNLEREVYQYARANGYWWLIPELSYAYWAADFIAWGPKKGILEIEVKRSWNDYRADGKKCGDRKLDLDSDIKYPEVSKHEWLRGDYPCRWRPTHFVFAAPKELAHRILDDPQLPKGFGVWSVETAGYRAEGPYYCVNTIKAMRRLIKIRPEQVGRFKKAAWERALWFMDTQYWK